MAPRAIFQGGPRPTNTLGSLGSNFTRIKDAAISGFKRSYQGSLDIVTSSGDNVQHPGKTFDLHADRADGPQKKKPRITTETSVPTDALHDLDTGDKDDTIMLDQRTVERVPPLSRKSSHSSSLLSQGSGVNSNAQSFRGRSAGVQEYRAVEQTMRTGSKSRQRPRKTQQITISASATPPIMIDLSVDDAQVPESKQPYQGTAKETKPRNAATAPNTGKVANAVHLREGIIRSSHFPNADKAKLSSKMRDMAGMPNGSDLEPRDLRTSFVDDEGNRRNSLIGDSPDELGDDTTLGSFPTKPRRSPSLSVSNSRRGLEDTGSRSTTPSRQIVGLPGSNIRKTEFTSGRRSGKDPKFEERSKSRATLAQWAVPLKGFRKGHIDLNGRTGCGLVYDETEGQFMVQHEGKYLAKEVPELSIRPQKVQRVVMGSEENGKMQLLVSRSGSSDCRIDVELCSRKDVCDFAERLQQLVPGCSIKLLPRSVRPNLSSALTYLSPVFHICLHCLNSDKMDRVFGGRSSQVDQVGSTKQGSGEIPYEDLQLLLAKKQKRISNIGAAGAMEKTYGKRPPRTLEVSDFGREALLDKAVRKDIENNPHQYPSLSLNPLQRTMITGKDREGGINTHQRLSSNPHETRSRMRSSAKGDLQSIEPSPSPLEPPPHQRYSRVHGLGTPWSKPLVYPQVGKRKATVEWKDLARLDEGEFLNDNLIGFYLRYLEYQLEQEHPELAEKVYFFNTYFFASLTNTPRGKKGINYEAVQKWTRAVDIFGYDFVVVPINESAHWYVTIICNLPALDRSLDPGDEQAALHLVTDVAQSPGDTEDRPNSSVQDYSSPEIYVDGSKTSASDSDADSTRDSFAGMNLDEKKEQCGTEQARALDVEISNDNSHERPDREEHQEHRKPLDDQSVPGSDVPFREVDRKVMEVLSSKAKPVQPNTPSSAKKGRRKSAPPLHKYDPSKPVIITLDSLGLSHSPTIRILKDYLAQEGKAKRSLEYPDDAIRGMTAKEIPLQDNFCDCGLYLLGYMDKLVLDPQDFCYKILQRELDVGKDWPSLNPSQMRDQLRTRIQELHTDQEDERKENAKKAGKYVSRKFTKPALSPARAAEPVPLVIPDESAKEGSQITREEALKIDSRIDQDDRPKTRPAKNLPTITPSLEELKPREKVAETTIPKIASQEDSLVFLGENSVAQEGRRQRGLSRPIGRSTGNEEQSSSVSATPSPSRLIDNPDVISSNPTPGNPKRWQARDVLGAPGRKVQTAVYPVDP
ncbi:MAG: hypothetical protein M1830_009984 [Pleopsidium flavum]|nr:MAG: hypothetical protein M1830_009984 [Pleopsidium flavum]